MEQLPNQNNPEQDQPQNNNEAVVHEIDMQIWSQENRKAIAVERFKSGEIDIKTYNYEIDAAETNIQAFQAERAQRVLDIEQEIQTHKDNLKNNAIQFEAKHINSEQREVYDRTGHFMLEKLENEKSSLQGPTDQGESFGEADPNQQAEEENGSKAEAKPRRRSMGGLVTGLFLKRR